MSASPPKRTTYWVYPYETPLYEDPNQSIHVDSTQQLESDLRSTNGPSRFRSRVQKRRPPQLSPPRNLQSIPEMDGPTDNEPIEEIEVSVPASVRQKPVHVNISVAPPSSSWISASTKRDLTIVVFSAIIFYGMWRIDWLGLLPSAGALAAIIYHLIEERMWSRTVDIEKKWSMKKVGGDI